MPVAFQIWTQRHPPGLNNPRSQKESIHLGNMDNILEDKPSLKYSLGTGKELSGQRSRSGPRAII
jgi:hypothetical protein